VSAGGERDPLTLASPVGRDLLVCDIIRVAADGLARTPGEAGLLALFGEILPDDFG
jgi:hypothetical protein